MDVPLSGSVDSSGGDAAPDSSLSLSHEDDEAEDHERHPEADIRPAILCAFIKAEQSLDAPVIDLAEDCVTLKTPREDHSFAIDYVQPSAEVTARDLLAPIAAEVLAGRSATILCVDAGGDSASWLLGSEPSEYADGALWGLVSQLTSRVALGTHVHFSALECFQEKLTDLQSQKPVEFADGPHGRSSHIATLSFRDVRDAVSLGPILGETMSHSRFRVLHKRSHIFFRIELSNDAQRMPPPSPRKPSVARTPTKAPNTPRSKARTLPALTIALLAPYDPTQKEFLSKEQNDIKRSLFNLGLMIDILNKETASIGFNWRTNRLTRLLRDTFISQQQLLLTVHTIASKEQLSAAQWAFQFATSAKRTRAPRKVTRTLFPSTPERPTHTTVIATLEQRLHCNIGRLHILFAGRGEVKIGAQNAELLKKERARSLELLKKLQVYEDEAKKKDEEISTLRRVNANLEAESKAQFASIDRLAVDRSAHYVQKITEQERMFLQQNAALRRLEQRMSSLLQQLKDKNYPIVISEREVRSAAEEAEEAELLIGLQGIIRSQVQSISTFVDQQVQPSANSSSGQP